MAAERIPAVTAAITAAAALGGQAIAGRFQGRNQVRIDASQPRDRAAEVLAEVRAFLVDSFPDRLGFNASPERSPEVLRELRERRERIRIPLLTLADSHPSPHIHRLAQQLKAEMANMLQMAEWFVTDLLRNRDSRAARDQANQHHTAAPGLLDQLLDAIHEPETGRAVGGGLFWRRELPGREAAVDPAARGSPKAPDLRRSRRWCREGYAPGIGSRSSRPRGYTVGH